MKDIIKEFRKLYGDDLEGGFRSKIETFILKALKEREEGYRAEMIEEIKGMETLIISGRNVDHFPVETAYIKKHDLINIINNK